MRRILPYALLLFTMLLFVACGGGGGAGGGGGGGGVTVTVLPGAVTITVGASQPFTATVTGAANQDVTWSVDGGDANGTIAANGLYSAPGVTGTYTVRATSVAAPGASGTATVTVDTGGGTLNSFLYVANRGIDPQFFQEIGVFEMFSTGALTLVEHEVAESFTAGIAVSADGNYLYASHVLSNTIEQFQILSGGALVPISPPTVTAGGDAWDIEAHPSRSAVYVVDSSNNRLYQFAISGSGSLTPLGSGFLSVGDGPKNIAFSADGNTLYLTHDGEGTVRQFVVAGDGSLTVHSTPTVPADFGAWGIVVAPSGAYAYVACSTSGTVRQYSIGAGGTLVPLSSPVTITGVINRTAMISTDGSFFYTADYGDGTGTGDAMILQYVINGNGTLNQLFPWKVSTGDSPMPIFVAPGTNLAYVANQGSNTVGIYTVGANGQLTQVGLKVTGEPGAGPAAFGFVQQ